MSIRKRMMSLPKRILVRLMWRFVPHSIIVRVDRLWSGLLDVLPALVSQMPSHDIRIGVYRVLGAKIGHQTSIHRGCQFYNIRGLEVGSNTVINPNVVLDAREGLSIGRNVSISEQACIYTCEHDIDDPDFRLTGGRTIIGDYVFIGARSIILPGICVGDGAAVAAGAVVTHDVPPYILVAGVPAKPIRSRPKNLRYSLDYRRTFY